MAEQHSVDIRPTKSYHTATMDSDMEAKDSAFSNPLQLALGVGLLLVAILLCFVKGRIILLPEGSAQMKVSNLSLLVTAKAPSVAQTAPKPFVASRSDAKAQAPRAYAHTPEVTGPLREPQQVPSSVRMTLEQTGSKLVGLGREHFGERMATSLTSSSTTSPLDWMVASLPLLAIAGLFAAAFAVKKPTKRPLAMMAMDEFTEGDNIAPSDSETLTNDPIKAMNAQKGKPEADVDDSVVRDSTRLPISGVPEICCPTCLRPLAGTACLSCSLQYNATEYLDVRPASGTPLNSEGRTTATRQSSMLMDIPGVDQALPIIERAEKVIGINGDIPKLSSVIKGGYGGDAEGWGTSTFQSPVVSGIYEKGWRQGFARAGFPGVDKEFEKALQWLVPVGQGSAVMDLSCGSGLFTRKFLVNQDFSHVVALDYSDSMLMQVRMGIEDDAEAKKASVGRLTLVRADVARMPFASGTFKAIHAGAAIHCWPSPSLAMSEIFRVLEPGGRAVLSTFLVPGQNLPFLNEDVRRLVGNAFPRPASVSMKYWEVSELEDLCASVGFTRFTPRVYQDSIIFMVQRPEE